MFIVQPQSQPDAQPLLEAFLKQFGSVPPHFELMATLNPKRFEIFVEEIIYLAKHPHINPDFFAFLRLYIATKESFAYCQQFNTKLLQSKGYSEEQIQKAATDYINFPLDEKHRLLAQKALLSIYEPEEFQSEVWSGLKEKGWCDADIFDAVDHAAFLFKNARVIKAFSQ